MRPVPDAPALLLEPTRRTDPRTIVVADIHLGLGSSVERPLGPPEGSADRLAGALVALARTHRAGAVLIAGDAKHPIVGTPPALRPVVFDFFAELLHEGLEVDLVLGNHDVGIVRHLPREVSVHPATGLVRGEVGVFHGHRWPSNAVLKAPTLVAGHLHPGFRLAPTADNPEGKLRCWVRVERTPAVGRAHRRRRHIEPRAHEVVILPAFNPIAGTESLNRERPARGRSFLYRRFLASGEARAFLLDGTDLGKLTTSYETGPRSREAGRSQRGR
ncbi:MAG TPA: metallophosphoesterase [Thermoplasmata archaeon]|nr:metallophosphoesterase [Thermoplasmata archaeon]